MPILEYRSTGYQNAEFIALFYTTYLKNHNTLGVCFKCRIWRFKYSSPVLRNNLSALEADFQENTFHDNTT